MGKRSDFQRRKNDAYDTPREAVAPLVQHLPRHVSYYEPCVGDGALVRHLSALKPCSELVGFSDVEPRGRYSYPQAVQDALTLELPSLAGCEVIITNPPWTRAILHPMIEHLSDMRPTWLLFDADWLHTKQAAPYLPRLRKIVSVGRVKWIPDSPHTGKDNAAWYLFDKPSAAAPEFYGRAA